MKEISDRRKILLGFALLVSSIASAQETSPEVFFPEKNPNAAKARANESKGSSLSLPNAAEAQPKVNHVFASEPDNFYHSVNRCLLDDGFSMDEIDKISDGNFLRVFDIATKK